MDRLSEDAELAERMSISGREQAVNQGFPWSMVIESWIKIYQSLAATN
jgi:glycosyltransferase involved in cell wall biosynthesis